MAGRSTPAPVALRAIVAFLAGAIGAGGGARSAVSAGSRGQVLPDGRAKDVHDKLAARTAAAPAMASLVNFADVVERLNPAVVNIDTTTRGQSRRRRGARPALPDSPDPFDGPFDFGTPPDRDAP